jgi:D-glycero-alpha-D-manno-heptose-7-phosphate kinase
MILVRTPFRVSLFGGGTDYPGFVRRHGGLVVGTAIDRYSYWLARGRPLLEGPRMRVVYRQVEEVDEADDLEHRAVRACLWEAGLGGAGVPGLELVHHADLPARSGLGTSSAFVVGLLNALEALRGRHASAEDLRRRATEVEQGKLAEAVGGQDQAFAAYGGFSEVRFYPSGTVRVSSLELDGHSLHDLRRHLLLVYLGGRSGTASEVARTYADDPASDPVLLATRKLAEDGLAALRARDWHKVGTLLEHAWRAKRSLSSAVSSAVVDRACLAGRVAGAWGGKLLGAGGGGCLLFCGPPERLPGVAAAVGGTVIDFDFEPRGSAVVYSDGKGISSGD